jgi:CRISPR-associated endoribonuclease Cas6
VRIEHVHAAFSRWFDRNAAEHAFGDKPYSLSPMTHHADHVGVLINVLTPESEQRLIAGAESATTVRLGNQIRPVGRPVRLLAESWAELAGPADSWQWTLDLLTPATFRSGDRSSPMPTVDTIVRGLARAWRWCDRLPDPDRPGQPELPASFAGLWVSDLNLRSHVLEMRVNGRDGVVRPVTLSGVTGSLTFRASDAQTAAWAAPLLRLAPYCGLGSMRAKGLGFVDLDPSTAPPLRSRT